MARHVSHHVFRRQFDVDDDSNDPDDCPWEYCSETAYIIKWVIVALIFALILIFVVGGYWHAQRRMKRGQAPLRYHRWLLSRQARERFFPPPQPQNSAAFYRPSHAAGGYGPPQEYQMNNYGYVPPPPAYHESESAPKYTPPSKVNPDQVYAPPPGSPPAQTSATASSSAHASGPSQPSRVASLSGNNK